MVKNPPDNAGDVRDVGSVQMAAHSSILAWRIPWTEETGGLWSTGSQRAVRGWSDLAGYLPSREIVGSCGSSIPSYLRNLRTDGAAQPNLSNSFF